MLQIKIYGFRDGLQTISLKFALKSWKTSWDIVDMLRTRLHSIGASANGWSNINGFDVSNIATKAMTSWNDVTNSFNMSTK